MARYKYASVHEWLIEWAGKLNADELFQEFTTIARELDADKIQDLYQSEMDRDGFFQDLDKTVTQEQYDKIIADGTGSAYCAECKEVRHFAEYDSVIMCGVCGEELEVTE